MSFSHHTSRSKSEQHVCENEKYGSRISMNKKGEHIHWTSAAFCHTARKKNNVCIFSLDHATQDVGLCKMGPTSNLQGGLEYF